MKMKMASLAYRLSRSKKVRLHIIAHNGQSENCVVRIKHSDKNREEKGTHAQIIPNNLDTSHL